MSHAAPRASSGSRMAVWKHDPTNPEDVGRVFVGSKVLSGPCDEDIRVLGIGRRIEPDGDNDFLPGDGNGDAIDAQAFDAVHTFAVVRQVLTMYRRAVTRLEGPEKAREVVDWYWNKTGSGGPVDEGERSPLTVYPRFGPGTGGYYSRKLRQLEFEYFDPWLVTRTRSEHKQRLPGLWDDGRIFLCRFFDVVAHETGHAVLDGLRRGKNDPSSLESLALHEAFADFSAVFAYLSQLGHCERLIVDSKGELLGPSPVNVIGRTLGAVLYGRDNGLRSLVERVGLEEAGGTPHRLSQVFTGAVYRSVARMFALYQRREWLEPAETLLRVARHVMELVLSAFRRVESLRFEAVCGILCALHEDRLKAPSDIALLGDRVASLGILEEELDEIGSHPFALAVEAGTRERWGCFGPRQ